MGKMYLKGVPYGIGLMGEIIGSENYSFSVDYNNRLFNQAVTTWPAQLEYTATQNCVCYVTGMADSWSGLTIYVNGVAAYTFEINAYKACVPLFLKKGDTVTKRILPDSPTIYVRYSVFPIVSQSLHDYSTTEQVVGTWIDNKPIYEKILEFTIDSTTKGNYVGFNHNISNIDKIVDVKSFFTNDNGVYYNSARFSNYNSETSNFNAYNSATLVAATRTEIGFQIGTGITSDYNKVYVTLRYTKTTD